jgi:hypothetical protein
MSNAVYFRAAFCFPRILCNNMLSVSSLNNVVRKNGNMTIESWLRISAIGISLIGALAIWLWGNKLHHTQRWLAGTIFGTAGLIAMTLFLISRHYACIFTLGKQNCLFDGMATLSLFLLNLVLAGASFVTRSENRGYDYILMLLLSSAWAGMGLAENLLVFLIFLYLFFFVLNRWIKMKGFKSGFLVLRDDYEDDQK